MSPSARRLSERVAWVREYLRRRAALAVGLWVAVGVALFLVAAWIAAGDDGWRQGSNVPALFDGLILVWILAGAWAFRAGVRRWFDEVPLSHSIERSAGLRPGIVRGTLELSRSVPHGVSGSLAERAVERTAFDLEGRSAADLAGELGGRVALWIKRGLVAVSLALVALVVLGIASPERTANVWAGVSSPLSTMVDPVLPPLVVRPGSVEVLRGTDVRVDVEALGRLDVELVWQSAGDVVRSESLPVSEGRASYVFEAISATTEYRVRSADGSVTATYEIVPVDPLFVSDLLIRVAYPPHTGLPPDEYRGDTPELRLPVGSRLAFEGLTSRPLSTVELVDAAGRTGVSLEVDGNSFEGSWTPRRDGVFEWAFRDLTGAPAEIQPEPLAIRLVPDSVPTVAILLPGQDTVLPLSLRQPLVVDGRDDYGLSRIELVAYRVTAFGERHDPVTQGLDLGGTRAALARPLLDLSSWGLLPGDTVRYFARVVDNSPAAQVGVSREYALRMQDVAELRREAEATLESVADRLEALQAEAARQAEENRNEALEDAGRRDDQGDRTAAEPDFEEREELLSALEEQAQLLDQVDSLYVELDELERRMEEAGQADPELAQELAELQELLQQLGADDLRDRMSDVEEALAEENQDASNQSLDNLAQQQQEFRERLESALERFRRAAVEQDLRATTDEASELARQERALADALREEQDPSARADQQAELAARTEELEARMEQLAERLREMGEETSAAGVQQAEQTAEQARERMEQARERAQQGDRDDAGAQADQAADQMQQAASQMQQAQEAMAQETLEEALAALQRTADDALSLARRQGTLRERMSRATEEEMVEMRSDEASLMRGVENIAQNLQAGSEATGGVDPALSAQLGRAMESIQGTIEALETRRSSSTTPAERAEQAIGALNQLALMAAAGAQQMGPMGAGQSGQDVAEQIGQLAQRQGELLSQTGQLVPMRLGQEAMQQQLQGISQQQQSVASDIGDLANDPGSDDALGDLEEMARQAEQLARQLAEGRLTPEIMQDQERLFHRLLDAGRSLEQEEFSEERESEQPGAFERAEVIPLSTLQLGVMPYELPDGEQLRRLTPAMRQLVLDYFERLNRTRPAGGGS